MDYAKLEDAPLASAPWDKSATGATLALEHSFHERYDAGVARAEAAVAATRASADENDAVDDVAPAVVVDADGKAQCARSLPRCG